jgi:predicted alpha-1,2-mannosidase
MIHYALALFLAGCATEEVADGSLMEHVDPFVGTGGEGFGVGSLSPAAMAPFGQMRVGPDTTETYGALGFYHCAGYYYDDDYIQAFSHTRLPGIGVSDGGAVGVMPSAVATMDRDALRAPLDHELEQASPGYYAVELPDLAAVELTATMRAAHHRYTWEGSGDRWLNFDLGHTAADDHEVRASWIEVDEAAGEVRGLVRMYGGLTGRGEGGLPTWFVARFDRGWSGSTLWLERSPVSGDRAEGVQTGVSLRFDGDVEVQVGISAVDLDGARNNLESELPAWDLEGTRAETEAQWAGWLDTIRVTGGNESARTIFASAAYHLFMLPTNFTDADRRYRGLDDAVHEADGWTYHTDFSLWDTYRTYHPLMTLVYPQKARDFARSLTEMGRQVGYLPRWPAGIVESGSMLGASADIVLGESYLKGVRDFDYETAFSIAYQQATVPIVERAREDLGEYIDRGYVPHDVAGEGAAKTLEYAINDFALGAWAAAMGQDDRAAHLVWRSNNYANVFDPETQFMRGRNSDGSWAELEDEGWGDAYAEGNAWQYTWLVPHDPQGLAELFGGSEAMVEKLSEMFELSGNEGDSFMPDPYYWHGNEPDLHASFLFAEVGRPDLTQEWVQWVRKTKYSASPAGLDGNDDGGTMSAWYVFAAMGLYPLNGTDRYVLTTPIFDQIVIQRPDGPLVIDAVGEGDYLAGVALDGAPLPGPSVRHSQLVGGRTLTMYRSLEPTDWGRW